MSQSRASFADRLYRSLLGLLPGDFRSEFGDDMQETFHAQRTATERERGLGGLLRMWWMTIADIVRMAPREHVAVLVQDTRYALRMMRKNSGYTMAAVLILGLGIGVNTSIFSVVNSVLLQPLPYTDGDRLVVLHQPEPNRGVQDIGFSPLDKADFSAQQRSLTGVVEYHAMTFTLLGGSEAHRVRTGVVSYNFFDLFGVKPILGRTFTADEEKPGAPALLMLSYEFWEQVEHGDRNIVGKVYQMNNRPHTVIGVLPPFPQYPNENDVYMTPPSCPFRSAPRSSANHGAFRALSLFGRLKPQVTPDMCRADLNLVAGRLAKDYPQYFPPDSGYRADATVLRDDLTRDARPLLLTLLAAAAFVLLIACANVANLILARMSRRTQELVIRTAVGAGASRLLRQLLTESFLMALLAAAVGVGFADVSLRLLVPFAGQLTPRAREISIDGWVLGFAVLCAAATTVLFGSLAAIHARRDVATGLRDGARAGGSRGSLFVRSTLIAVQVAFSFVLLTGAGLMIRSFIQMQRVNPGFHPQRVLAVGLNANWSKYKTGQDGLGLSHRLLERIHSQPGVLSAALALSFPMDPDTAINGGFNRNFQIEGAGPGEAAKAHVTASIRIASPEYFDVLGIPVLSGRIFTDADTRDAEQVALVSRSLANHRWQKADPVGRRISFDGEHWVRIVGIVGDVKERGPHYDAPEQLYLPLDQNPVIGTMLVRTASDPAAFGTLIRRAIHDVEPDIAVTHIDTLEQDLSDSVASPRTITRLFGLYAGLALLIAAIGIGSMLALWVRQSNREIGIRMALGAAPGDILRKVIRRGMVLVVAGLAFGVVGAAALTRLLKTMLFQVEPTDTMTFSLVGAVLLSCALLACYFPARRASRIDPQVVLRGE